MVKVKVKVKVEVEVEVVAEWRNGGWWNGAWQGTAKVSAHVWRQDSWLSNNGWSAVLNVAKRQRCAASAGELLTGAP
jgi:hypothetical protein